MAFANTYLERKFVGNTEYGIVKTTGVTADVNGLGTAFEVVPAVTGKIIKLKEWWIAKSGAAVHATNTTLWMITDTATRPQGFNDTTLLNSVAVTELSDMNEGIPDTFTQMIVSKSLKLVTSSGANPTGGTAGAAFTVYTSYMIYTP